MNIAARTRLAETEGQTNFELRRNFVPGSAQAGAAPSDVLAKISQRGRPNDNLLSANAVDISELYWSESSDPERSWRWPLSYRTIEVLAIFVDALIIIAAGV